MDLKVHGSKWQTEDFDKFDRMIQKARSCKENEETMDVSDSSDDDNSSHEADDHAADIEGQMTAEREDAPETSDAGFEDALTNFHDDDDEQESSIPPFSPLQCSIHEDDNQGKQSSLIMQ